jgi:hypothetical protein
MYCRLQAEVAHFLVLNPQVCAFPEACFGVSKRPKNSFSLGMEDAPQLAAGHLHFAKANLTIVESIFCHAPGRTGTSAGALYR